MSKQVLDTLESVKPGDLIYVDWLDASRGRIETLSELREVGASNAVIDSPVKSYGIFIGVFGKRSKHIVLVGSLWIFTAVADYGQVDTTIIPVGCVENVLVLQRGVLDIRSVKLCMSAFLQGRCRRPQFHRTFQFGNRLSKVKADAGSS